MNVDVLQGKEKYGLAWLEMTEDEDTKFYHYHPRITTSGTSIKLNSVEFEFPFYDEVVVRIPIFVFMAEHYTNPQVSSHRDW